MSEMLNELVPGRSQKDDTQLLQVCVCVCVFMTLYPAVSVCSSHDLRKTCLLSGLFCPPPPASKQQLYSVCKNMQTRVVELIPQLVDEGFIEELLMVNDDLNNAFIRYERWVGAFLQGTLLSLYNIRVSKQQSRNYC